MIMTFAECSTDLFFSIPLTLYMCASVCRSVFLNVYEVSINEIYTMTKSYHDTENTLTEETEITIMTGP